MSIRARLKNLEASKAGGLQVFLSEPDFETADGELRLARVAVWNSTVRLSIDSRAEESDVLVWGRTEKTVDPVLSRLADLTSTFDSLGCDTPALGAAMDCLLDRSGSAPPRGLARACMSETGLIAGG